MRIFATLNTAHKLTRDPGYWLSKRKALKVSAVLSHVLQLNQHQRLLLENYLQGSSDVNSDELERVTTPAEYSAISGFLGWYNVEYFATNEKQACYTVCNLNEGFSATFIHHGYRSGRSPLPEIVTPALES